MHMDDRPYVFIPESKNSSLPKSPHRYENELFIRSIKLLKPYMDMPVVFILQNR